MATPKYQRLVNELEAAISDGRFAPGARMPSVRSLMGMHKLSLTTVTTALAILEEHDLIEPRARSGFFVKSRIQSRKVPVESAAEAPVGFHWWPAPDLFPRERLRKLTASVVRRHPDLAIESPRNNHPLLLRELAKRCAEIGCYVHEADIMITHGVTEALSVALRASMPASRRLLVQAPVAPLYQAIAEHLEVECVPFEVRSPEKKMLEALEKKLVSNEPLTLLIASNFHCPTGATLSLEAKRQVLRLALDHNMTVIEDDSCGDLHFAKARPLPLKALDTDGRVIHVSAATKSISPGLQLGWIVSGSDWRERIEEYKSISSSAVDYLPQLVLAGFLSQGGHLPHLRKLRSALQKRVRAFETSLRPVLGSVRGLEPYAGGYNRFLWTPGGLNGSCAEADYTKRWPRLFGGSQPVFRCKGDGISANLSFDPDRGLCEEARSFGIFLRQQSGGDSTV